MRFFNLLPILIFVLIFNTACEKEMSITETAPVNAYVYHGFDSTGTQIAKGWLVFDVSDSSQITGVWRLEKTGNADNSGPQFGKGKFMGQLSNNHVSINLNPNMIDNNVILNGTITDKLFEGNWQWITFSGITNQGTFTAKK